MSDSAEPTAERLQPRRVRAAQWDAPAAGGPAASALPQGIAPAPGDDPKGASGGGPGLPETLDDSGEPPWQGGLRLRSEVAEPGDTGASQRPVAVLADPRSTAPELAAPDAPAAHAAGPSRRARRHRRGVLPSLVEAADIPEDADGRVTYYVLAPPPDTPPGPEPLPAAMAEAEPGPLEEALTRAATGPMRLILRGGVAGWAPVVLLGLLFVAVFVVGMRIAR